MASAAARTEPTPEHVARHVSQLEGKAAAVHLIAQQLNKAGKFEEAEAQYALMRRLENEAAQLAKGTGCAACVMGADGAPIVAVQEQAEQPALYQQLQRGCSWHDACAASGTDPAAAQQRALGAVLGSAVGDAAAMSVQWIYDLSVLEALKQSAQLVRPEGADWGLAFYDPPSSPFLKPEDGYASVGRFSPYFEAVTPLLASLAARGGLDCNDYADRAAAAFGEGSGFSGYCNASMRGFLRARSQGLLPPATGTDDKQADCVARLAPLVVAFGGDAGALAPCVEAATRVTQNQDEAVAWALAGAAVLERLVVGGVAPRQAVEETARELRSGAGRFVSVPQAPTIAGMFDQVVALRAEPHTDVVSSLGRNCHLPNSCQTPLHALLHAEWRLEQQGGAAGQAGGWALGAAAKQGLYKAAVRDALAGGGCCASRSCFAGACLGGWLGPDAVPPAWAAKCTAWERVQAQAEALCAARGA